MEVSRKHMIPFLMLFIMVVDSQTQLKENFYGLRCPNVELIVQQTVFQKFQQTFTTIPGTLRLFFHDCFVEGCDASVLLMSPNGDAERDSDDGESLAGDGFDTVVKAKSAVEAQCPGVVSCADILALAARDVVVLAGGPSFRVELGRRDGRVSQASKVRGNLPEPGMNHDELTAIFARNKLSKTDMVALSGAHTVGFSHCKRFFDRIYNFSRSSPIDPSLDPDYAGRLIEACPKNVDPEIAIDIDPTTPRAFDNEYFKNLVGHKGLFTSDQVLFTNPTTQRTVMSFANDSNSFFAAFVVAMRKLGRVNVKVGRDGEIRRDCSAVNS